jgi:N-acetyltransferase
VTEGLPRDPWPSVDPDGAPVSFGTTDPIADPRGLDPVLTGRIVRLEPLGLGHLDALCAVGLSPGLWRFTPQAVVDRDGMRQYVEDALSAHASGAPIPFATVLIDGERVVGSTRFMSIDRANRRLEIGSTWISPDFQRTGVNTEAKLLMLRYAFETLGCNRVELKTDSFNLRSRAAILRIGARFEGIFRNHVITRDGRMRHSVYFAVTSDEWPAVKERLQGLMDRA